MKKTGVQILPVKLHRFEKQGEKTGWTYIEIPSAVAEKICPGTKKSFRVKGKMDDYQFRQVATVPMGEGNFIIAFNAAMRKGTGKKEGDTLILQLELETEEMKIAEDLLNSLAMDEDALAQFISLARGHQQYFSNWIESSKTIGTKSDRIAKTLFAMQHKMDYGQMIRHFKALKG